MAENNVNHLDKLTFEREKRKFEKRREEAESAEEKLGKFIKTALKNENTVNNIAKQGIEVTKNRYTLNDVIKRSSNGDGFNIVEEGIVTGFEERPWEKD